VVGRIFDVGAGRWLPSSAASVFRPGGSLGEAFARDVGSLELGRRLLQIELEHSLLRPHEEGRLGVDEATAPRSAPLEHLEADLDRLLQDKAEDYSATAISEQLAAVERPGQVIGPLLEEIAFETKADLDAVRRVLLEIWNSQHADRLRADTIDATGTTDTTSTTGPEGAGPPGESLGEQMVRRLDDGLGKKRDLEGLFAELEEMAGLEPGAADDGENPFDRARTGGSRTGDTQTGELQTGEIRADAPVGNLTPLVEEYLWETGATDGEVAAVLRTWVELQGNAAVPQCDLEEVSGTDLMRVLLHVFLAASPARRCVTVRAAFAALREFYSWAERTQDLDLAANLSACRGALLDQLDRLTAASTGLSTSAVTKHRPAMFEIEEIGPKGFGMRDDDGGGFWLDVPDSVCSALCVGDLLLGAVHESGGFAGPVVVLPAETRALME